MHRHKERGFCCGAGGARMWVEERIGKRINAERVDEALVLDPDIVSTACPFRLVVPTDSVNGKKAAADSGSAAGGTARRPSRSWTSPSFCWTPSGSLDDGPPAGEADSENAPEPQPVK